MISLSAPENWFFEFGCAGSDSHRCSRRRMQVDRQGCGCSRHQNVHSSAAHSVPCCVLFGAGLRRLLFGGESRLAGTPSAAVRAGAVCAVLVAAVSQCVVVIGAAQAAAVWFLAVVCACCCSVVVCDNVGEIGAAVVDHIRSFAEGVGAREESRHSRLCWATQCLARGV